MGAGISPDKALFSVCVCVCGALVACVFGGGGGGGRLLERGGEGVRGGVGGGGGGELATVSTIL